MKKVLFFVIIIFVVQSGLSHPIKKLLGNFVNISVSENICFVENSTNRLVLSHLSMSEPVQIVYDGINLYLEYKGEVMGHFLSKFNYDIIPGDNRLEIIVKTKAGKKLNEYFIEEIGGIALVGAYLD